MSITAQQKELVQSSWKLVEPISGVAADLFYDRLFAISPTTPALFKSADMAVQKKKLFDMLGAAVRGLDDVAALVPVLKGLGKRHSGYGVKPADYASVGAAFLWTLEQGLKDKYTKEHAEAWTAVSFDIWKVERYITKVYGVVSTVMQQGADEAK